MSPIGYVSLCSPQDWTGRKPMTLPPGTMRSTGEGDLLPYFTGRSGFVSAILSRSVWALVIVLPKECLGFGLRRAFESPRHMLVQRRSVTTVLPR